MEIQEVIARLNNVKPAAGGYNACCPAHDDRHPSLSVSQGADGRILLHCHAGCPTEDILAKLGLAKTDLFVKPAPARSIAAVYDYTDENGNLLFQKVRYEPKDFRCRIPDGRGGWIYQLNGTRRVLYNLPHLIKNDIVFAAEGEKDCCTLGRYGYCAVTNFDGAGKWSADYNPYFKGKIVYIIPDNDTPGRRHAEMVFKNLQPLAAECRIVQLPSPYKDVSDFFAAGGTVEQFNDLCLKAPCGIPAAWQDQTAPNRLQFVNLDDVQVQQMEWLWPNRIPKGMLSLIVGNPNAGKTFAACSIIASVTTAGDWPDCLNTAQPGRVLFFGEEDSFSRILKPRILANGGDCRLVSGFECVLAEGKEQEFSVAEHIELLQKAVDSFGDVALIVFDPITAYLRRVNANDNVEVRCAMIGLQRLAQKTGVTILGLSHFSKKADLEAIYRILGSTAFVAAARSVWAVIHEKTDSADRRIFAPIKSNYSIDPTGLAFKIIDGAVCWQPEPIEQPIDAILQQSADNRRREKNLAKDWLKHRLEGSTLPAVKILADAEAAGFSRTTIHRAADDLGVLKKRSAAEGNRSFWSLFTDR